LRTVAAVCFGDIQPDFVDNMEYISVFWKHESNGDPVRLVSELDDERYERRKLEFFRDGTVGVASTEREDARTMLGIAPVPPLAQINEDPEFEGTAIGKSEFDGLWSQHEPTG
jgi:hypothetical protein